MADQLPLTYHRMEVVVIETYYGDFFKCPHCGGRHFFEENRFVCIKCGYEYDIWETEAAIHYNEVHPAKDFIQGLQKQKKFARDQTTLLPAIAGVTNDIGSANP